MPNIDLSILNQRQTPAFYADVFANRPAAGFVGRIFISTNTFVIYRDNGTTWDIIGGGGAGAVTGSGAAGQVSYWSSASAITGSNDLFWDATNGHLGVNTNAPGTALDVHHDQPTVAIVNQTVATNDVRIGFQNNGVGLWRIGAFYNGGANDFGIYDAVAAIQPVTVKKTTGQVLIGTSTVGSGKLVVASTTGDNGIQIVGASAPSLRIDNAEIGATKRAGFGISTAINNFIQGSADRDFCIFNGSTTPSPILFGIYDAGLTNVQEAVEISAIRNLIIGGGADSGQKLQVVGTALFSGSVTGTGNTSNYNVTATSGVASSKRISSTLIAAANGDILVGLDINPTFSSGAFTTTTYGLRINNALYIGLGKSNIASNIVIGGSTSGRFITSATNATIVGNLSSSALTTGTANTAIGASTMTTVTTASDNTAIGAGSLATITGSSNTSIGSAAMGSASGNAANNTALGVSALSAITSGSQNLALGRLAIRYLNTGNFNIAVGNDAGSTYGASSLNNTAPVGGVFIGYLSRSGSLSTTNEVVISGYTGTGLGGIGLGSNTTTIGNSSTTFTAIYGNLLIGTQTNGASKLRIVGLPTSAAGLSSGDIYSNAGILTIVP